MKKLISFIGFCTAVIMIACVVMGNINYGTPLNVYDNQRRLMASYRLHRIFNYETLSSTSDTLGILSGIFIQPFGYHSICYHIDNPQDSVDDTIQYKLSVFDSTRIWNLTAWTNFTTVSDTLFNIIKLEPAVARYIMFRVIPGADNGDSSTVLLFYSQWNME